MFDQEDFSGRLFLDTAVLAMPWKDLATAATQMAFSSFFYCVQLRASAEAARCCERGDEHLAALARAVPDDLPTRTEPPGAWRVRALVDGSPVTLAEHLCADRAEGEPPPAGAATPSSPAGPSRPVFRRPRRPSIAGPTILAGNRRTSHRGGCRRSPSRTPPGACWLPRRVSTSAPTC